jgi:Rps23 Pro-64 3,4-dihydroxylase Tpa1-like proline 4-hydroxylase
MVEMNKEEIAPGIVVYSDVIPNSDTLYKDIEEGMNFAQLKWMPAPVKTGSGSEATVEYKIRDTDSIGIPYKGKIEDTFSNSDSETFYINLNNLFFKNFDPIEKNYMAAYEIGSDWHATYGILKYGPGQQFTNHIDDNPTYHRRISTVYYLNENYTGGEINFPRFNITFKPKANQMLVFPSTYVYNHSVFPVIDGTRYAVVSWLR